MKYKEKNDCQVEHVYEIRIPNGIFEVVRLMPKEYLEKLDQDLEVAVEMIYQFIGNVFNETDNLLEYKSFDKMNTRVGSPDYVGVLNVLAYHIGLRKPAILQYNKKNLEQYHFYQASDFSLEYRINKEYISDGFMTYTLKQKRCINQIINREQILERIIFTDKFFNDDDED